MDKIPPILLDILESFHEYSIAILASVLAACVWIDHIIASRQLALGHAGFCRNLLDNHNTRKLLGFK
jgi:hypothetical protein